MKLDYCSGKFSKVNFKFGYTNSNVEINKYTQYKIDPETHKINSLENNSCNVIRVRNVLHHIKNLKDIFMELDRLLNHNGVLIISEPQRKYWIRNIILDYWWYRIKRFEPYIWIAIKYRRWNEILNKLGYKFIMYDFEKYNRIEIWEK